MRSVVAIFSSRLATSLAFRLGRGRDAWMAAIFRSAARDE